MVQAVECLPTHADGLTKPDFASKHYTNWCGDILWGAPQMQEQEGQKFKVILPWV